MTLAELQRLIMRQAVLKLERLGAELAAKEAAPPAEHDPARPWRATPIDYLREEIADQGILIAKLTYNHEREQAEADRIEEANALHRSETIARIGEIEHLIKFRNATLDLHARSNEIQREGFAAVAAAIAGHHGGS